VRVGRVVGEWWGSACRPRGTVGVRDSGLRMLNRAQVQGLSSPAVSLRVTSIGSLVRAARAAL
jgi:hypothetical protein